ncbi:sensor histidine kinase [Clostridium formicaceticum]|uniref:histidine kinase n=1 Tax=Clostridium formicaceticum TaxID=1497 RepID=A0AAC9WH33_9CLOT|nr:histidine kinase [Clostridium formicaceticum]AOY78056.1 two-component sensor histidine kinase [Clostridium formicaceticum]ARE88692.1 Sensor histidine kinase DesK [Clostridium formicaceticum]
MISKQEIYTAKVGIILGRVFGLSLLSLLWLGSDGTEVGVVLLLFLLIMALTRWRFDLPGWTVIIDQAACFIIMPYWPQAFFGLVLPIFEAMIKGQAWLALPGFAWVIVYEYISIPLFGAFMQAVFVGWLIRGWATETNVYRQEADRERRERYALESFKGELLLANIQAARMAELSERNRIAQELHDDVGHELTAAVLALQAFEHLWKEDNPSAQEMFSQAQQRLSNSALHLRETVHNMKPVKAMGIDALQEICKGFTACPINFQVYGDTSKVSVYLWSILQPCLKEALTNVIRHAEATMVEVCLDVNPHIVRLSIYNDGTVANSRDTGIGLRNLRQRVKAVGGSISIDTADGFRLICVLPMEKNTTNVFEW